MAAPQDLKDLYTDEMKDLWSANDQMQRCVKKLVAKASDKALKDLLTQAQQGIVHHTSVLKELIAINGEKVSKEHCKGMEGLVAEATKHTGDEAPKKGPLLDAVIIAQYRRMTHYGIAGFGTASSYAKALNLRDDHAKLKAATKEIYGGDVFTKHFSNTAATIEPRA